MTILYFDLQKFKPNRKSSWVLGGDLFKNAQIPKNKRKKIVKLEKLTKGLTRKDWYACKILNAIEDGKFVTGIITDATKRKIKTNYGEESYTWFNLINENKQALIYIVNVLPFLNKLKKKPIYQELFNRHLDKILHMGDLTTILAAIELGIPRIVSDDPHFRNLRNKVKEIYRKAHSKERAEAIIKKKKFEDLEIYGSNEFCAHLNI